MNKNTPLLTALALGLLAQAGAAQTSRDPWLWPFASSSIWNTSIGSGAVYKAANITDAYSISTDDEILTKTYSWNPSRTLFEMGNWFDRDSGTVDTGKRINLPDNFIVPDAYVRPDGSGHTPNNCSAFLRPDGKTLLHVAPLTRPTNGGNVWGFPGPPGFYKPEISLTGDGLGAGAHQSELSAIGGSVRLGELFSAQPIRHALKINLWAKRYFYHDISESDGKAGFRWPATGADFYAGFEGDYNGTNTSLQHGTLLAIPPSVTQASLNLETAPARKLFFALQNYGAYVVDDTAWDSHALCVEDKAVAEFTTRQGYDYYSTWDNPTPFYRDVTKLYKALSIVDNNGPNSIGGGGTRRQADAPPINRVLNMGFEETGPNPNPLFWTKWSNTASETASYSEAGGRSGASHGTHWSANAYRVYTSQRLTGLSNGLYTARVWVRSSGGQITCQFQVEGYSSPSVARVAAITAASGWTMREIRDINVQNGAATVGIWSDARAGNWVNFDDLEFYKQ